MLLMVIGILCGQGGYLVLMINGSQCVIYDLVGSWIYFLIFECYDVFYGIMLNFKNFYIDYYVCEIYWVVEDIVQVLLVVVDVVICLVEQQGLFSKSFCVVNIGKVL